MQERAPKPATNDEADGGSASDDDAEDGDAPENDDAETEATRKVG